MATKKTTASAATPRKTRTPTRTGSTPTATATHAAHADLLAAVIHASDQDVQTRVVYADVLEQAGDPRGEFIAVQCALAELAEGDARAAALEARAAELLKKHKKTWTAVADASGARWEYRRGFAEKLSIDAGPLASNGNAIFAAEPIRELSLWKLDKSPGALDAIVAMDGLTRVTFLSLARSEIGTKEMRALASAATLERVRVLDLTACRIGDDAAEILAKAKMPALEELRLGHCELGDRGMAAVARAAFPLKRLIAPRSDIRERGAVALAEAHFGDTLVHLDLSSNEAFGATGLSALVKSTKLTALRSLRLEYCGVADSVIDDLLASDLIARLEHLDVSQGVSQYGRDRLHAKLGDRLKG